jgi:hypothetical protein
MRRAALLLSALVLLCTSAHAAEPQLTIDTPVHKLLDDPRTKPVVEKHLPRLVKSLTEDQQAQEMFATSSLRELSVDPHVRGITEEMLKALQADLLAAQTQN